MRTPALWRAEQQVNTTDGAAAQSDGQIVGMFNGNYVGVWTDPTRFGGQNAIIGRLFDANGNPLTEEVNLTAPGIVTIVPPPAFAPDIAALPNSGLAVAYLSQFSSTDRDVRLRTFGATLAQQLDVSVDDSSLDAANPSVTAFTNGDMFVTWTQKNSATDWDILGKAVSATGATGSVITLVDSNNAHTDNSRLATLTGGNLVVLYDTEIPLPIGFNRLAFQIRGPNGAVVGADTEVRTPLNVFSIQPSKVEADLAPLRTGGFAVTWTGEGDGGIHLNVYDRDGATVRHDVLVSSATPGNNNESHVTGLDDGGLMVSWEDDGAGLTRAQRFDAAGNQIGQPVVVKNNTPLGSDLTMLQDGRTGFTFDDVSTGDADIRHSIWDTRHNGANMVSGNSIIGGAGSADFLMLRDSPGANAAGGIRTMTALQIENNVLRGVLNIGAVGTEWAFDGAGDFDKDGDADLLLHSDTREIPATPGATTGQPARLEETPQQTFQIFRVGPTGIVQAVTFGPVGTDWQVVGLGDFDRDLDDDMLLSRQFGGVQELQIFRFEDANFAGATALPAIGANLTLDEVGDFDRDGDDDVLAHFDVAGQRFLQIFRVENNTLLPALDVGRVGADWQIDGVGDFDRDGDQDIMMHRDGAANRQMQVLGVENGTINQAVIFGAIGKESLIDGFGDFDSDGDADVALHQDLGGIRNPYVLQVENFGAVATHIAGSLGTEWLVY